MKNNYSALAISHWHWVSGLLRTLGRKPEQYEYFYLEGFDAGYNNEASPAICAPDDAADYLLMTAYQHGLKHFAELSDGK